MVAYYNEIDPNAAEWLRQLIRMGQIAPGDVDERSIEDVTPNELTAYTQCHFFAGIGAWSYALRLAGWPDDRPVWTGSAPCQPFSTAGKGRGVADERHLWPAFFWLIQQCQPPTIFGEQVASKDGLGWWDIVSSDMEAADYACGAFDLCAAGIGAPHIRQRLYWVAHSSSRRGHNRGGMYWGCNQEVSGCPEAVGGKLRIETEGSCFAGKLAHSQCPERGPITPGGKGEQHGPNGEWQAPSRFADGGETGPLADPNGERRQQIAGGSPGHEAADGGKRWHGGEPNPDHQSSGDGQDGDQLGHTTKPGLSLRGFSGESTVGIDNPWANPEWIYCRDGKARPVEPSIFPLVDGVAPDLVFSSNHGLPDQESWGAFCEQKSLSFNPTQIQTETTAEGRVMRLKGYGNAIVAPLAAEFVGACMESLNEIC